MFNLIRIPYRMLLILALLIKEHEYVKGNKSIFLISAVMHVVSSWKRRKVRARKAVAKRTGH